MLSYLAQIIRLSARILESEKKLRHKEILFDRKQRMKEKRSEEYEVLEEVFDKSTLMTIHDFMREGLIRKIYGAISAGKESKVYWGVGGGGSEIAIKIYLTVSAEFRKGILPYIIGDPRFDSVPRRRRKLVYLWATKEFKNLKIAYEVGVRVPKPIAVKNNVLIMEFIGENGKRAPLLKEVKLDRPEEIYEKLLENIRALYCDGELVHGDLSEYNVMIYKEEPVIFDISQAVQKEHPLADYLLERDIRTLNNYFSKIGVSVKPVVEILKCLKNE